MHTAYHTPVVGRAAVIIVRLAGGLGNQMFQYATGRRLAEHHHVELVLDTSWTVEIDRPFELSCFDLTEQARPVWEVARVPNSSPVVRALQRVRPSRRRFLVVVSDDLETNSFQPAVLAAPNHAYLCGWWQFEGYFIDHEATIRRAFVFPPLSDESDMIAEQISTTTAVSVHVRRGDYLSHSRLGFLDESYYRRAVESIRSRVGDTEVFVFSDDPSWCKRQLQLPVPTHVIERRLPVGRDWEDMCLMSLCSHHVVANSTFSWWGAWLNSSPSKLVVAPSRWVQDEKRVGDPVLDSWIRV